MQFLAAYIMKGRLQAILFVSTLAILSLLFPSLSVVSIVSSAAIALVTLRQGRKQGGIILLGSTAALAGFSLVIFGSLQFALNHALIVWLPIWLISLILRETKRLILAIELPVVVAVLYVVGFYLYQPDPALFWRSLLNLMIQAFMQTQSDVSPEILTNSAETFSHYMTGVMAAGSVSVILLALFLARWWQANLYNPGGFRTEYLALRGNRILAVLTLLLLALAKFLDVEVCWNILIVLVLFYAFIGTAVMHSLLAANKTSSFVLPVFYLILLIIPQFTLLVALGGLGDTWLDLRNKFKPKGSEHS